MKNIQVGLAFCVLALYRAYRLQFIGPRRPLVSNLGVDHMAAYMAINAKLFLLCATAERPTGVAEWWHPSLAATAAPAIISGSPLSMLSFLAWEDIERYSSTDTNIYQSKINYTLYSTKNHWGKDLSAQCRGQATGYISEATPCAIVARVDYHCKYY